MKISLDVPESLLNQAEMLAKHLDISQNQLLQMALEQFIEQQTKITQPDKPQHIINQGDIYWLTLAEIPHPYVVVQDNVFNHSRIQTVIVCALTSNLKRATYPGNVLLEVNEANLTKQSVVEVSTVDKAQLGEYIGSISEQHIHQIFAGMRFLQMAFFTL